jgi:putative zinc finger/helix-turn-helix YgiT family protein
MVRIICPICEKISNVEIIRREETHTIRNEEITAGIEISRCLECYQEFETVEQMENNLEAFRSVYRQRYRILSPEEIVQLRKKYGISQKALGKILDIGELTINTYEQGALPSGAHNQLLQLISEPLIFKKVYDKNKKKLSPRQINKIEEHLNNTLNTTTYDPHLSDQHDMVAEKALVYGVWNHCGDILKLYAMVQIMLYEAAKPLYKMAVLKLLFYSDFAHYKEHKKAISNWRYVRLPYGPVPDDFKKLLLKGEEEGYFKVQPDKQEVGELLFLSDNFDITLPQAKLSASELRTIKSIVEKLGDKKAGELSRITHQEKAWLKTENGKEISYDWAESLVHIS